MWINIPSTTSPYAQAEPDSTSAWNWLWDALAQFVGSNGKPSPANTWRRLWKRAAWLKRLCGRICEPSMAVLGVESWIASLRVTRASHSASPAIAVDQTILGTYGPMSIAVIGEVEPAIVFLENVPGHLSLGFAEVATDLESMGYDVAAGLFTAEEVGASHKRERLFILAVANDQSERRSEGRPEPERRDGQSVSADAGSAVGNPSGLFSGRRTVAEREAHWRTASAGAGKDVADTQRAEWRTDGSRGTDDGGNHADGPQGSETPGQDGRTLAHAAHDHRRRGIGRKEEGIGPDGVGRRRSASRNSELADPEGRGTMPIQQPGQPCCTVPCRDKLADAGHEGLSDAQQPGISATAQRPLETGTAVEQFCFPQLFPPRPDDFDRWREVLAIDDALAPAQPALRLLADGLAEDRARWLRLYGNGVVPLQAAYAFCSLWAALRFNQ